MDTLTEAEFLKWTSAQGIELDPSYPRVAILRFGRGTSRFWDIPPEPERRPFFLAKMIELMGPWKRCYVWRHSGSWPDAKNIEEERINDAVEHKILSGLGLPMGTADVVVFNPDELRSLITLLFSSTIFGWSISQDLYIVPDSARFIVKTDHHNVVHAYFRESNDVGRAIQHMEAAGFALPEDVPDETFKPPPWMRRA